MKPLMIDWQNINDDGYPDSNREVIAKSPEGITHLAQWRPAYDIFTCQNKRESAIGWKWAYTNEKDCRKCYDLTESELNGRHILYNMASKDGYSSLISMLNEGNMWNMEVWKVIEFLEENETCAKE